MKIRTDRAGVLVEQLTDAAGLSRSRLDGMGDAEFGWEPFSDMWSIRRNGTAATPDPVGSGDWVLDADGSIGPFDPGPLTTIGWRIAHLVSGFAGRYEWTFGSRSIDPDNLVDYTPVANVMFDRLWFEIDRWANAVDATSSEHLDMVGYSQYPHGLDPDIAFIGIVRWMNREAIHHLAEAALLRDLHRTMSSR